MASLVQHRLPRSKWFYGKVKIDGKYKPVPLDVQVKGKPPEYRGDKGDDEYRRSMWEAEQRMEPLLEELEGLSFPEATKAIKRFGERMKKSKKGDGSAAGSEFLPIDDIADEWLKLPRKSKKARTGASYDEKRSHGAQMVSEIKGFIEFCKKGKPKLQYAFEIETDDALAYVQSEWKRKCTGGTCNKKITNLKSVFNRLKDKIGNTVNPFDGIDKFPDDTISRKAFNEDQVSLIYKYGMQHLEDVGGVMLAGIFTGMREGDCCTLRWEEVDLKSGKLKVTAEPTGGERTVLKTAEKIWIPMFPPFRDALLKLKPKKSGFIFPSMAQKYRAAPDSVSSRLVRAIEKVFTDDESFERTVKRKHGLRKASVYDFAALRTTWITLAVQSGVSIAHICLVSGHTSEAMILKHYLKPDSQDLQRSFESKMEALTKLGGPRSDSEPQLVEDLQILKGMLQEEAWDSISKKAEWTSNTLEQAIEKLGSITR